MRLRCDRNKKKDLVMPKPIIFEAIIFDFDGTIMGTQKYHAKAESKILLEHGIKVDPVEITRKYSGISTRKMFKDYLPHLKNGSLDALVRRKFDLLGEVVDSLDVEELFLPHAKETIIKIHERGYKLAIATASNRAYVEKILERSSIGKYFRKERKSSRPEPYDFVVTGEDVLYGKPSPDIYLKAAEILGVDPKDCAVVEDGISGMVAGKEAGMYVFGLSEREPSVFDNEVRENSHLLVRSWKVVDIFFQGKSKISTLSDISKYEKKTGY